MLELLRATVGASVGPGGAQVPGSLPRWFPNMSTSCSDNASGRPTGCQHSDSPSQQTYFYCSSQAQCVKCSCESGTIYVVSIKNDQIATMARPNNRATNLGHGTRSHSSFCRIREGGAMTRSDDASIKGAKSVSGQVRAISGIPEIVRALLWFICCARSYVAMP